MRSRSQTLVRGLEIGSQTMPFVCEPKFGYVSRKCG